MSLKQKAGAGKLCGGLINKRPIPPCSLRAMSKSPIRSWLVLSGVGSPDLRPQGAPSGVSSHLERLSGHPTAVSVKLLYRSLSFISGCESSL